MRNEHYQMSTRYAYGEALGYGFVPWPAMGFPIFLVWKRTAVHAALA